MFYISFFCMCSLTSSFGADSERAQGMWICTNLKNFSFTRSDTWNCRRFSYPTVKLFIEKDLFLKSARDIHIDKKPLKDFNTKDVKKVLDRAVLLLGGKYVCNTVYLDSARTTNAEDNNKPLANVLINNDFPIIKDIRNTPPEKHSLQGEWKAKSV